MSVNKCHRFMTFKNCHKILKFRNFWFFQPKMGIFYIYDTFFLVSKPKLACIILSLKPIFLVVSPLHSSITLHNLIINFKTGFTTHYDYRMYINNNKINQLGPTFYITIDELTFT